MKPEGVQHPIRRPSSSSHRHSSASCEGWALSTRGSRRGAERPRASLHRTKKPQAERSGHPPESCGHGSAGDPRHRADRGTAQAHRARRARRAVSLSEAAQDGAESCQPRLNDSRISLRGLDFRGGSPTQPASRARAKSAVPFHCLQVLAEPVHSYKISSYTPSAEISHEICTRQSMRS